jgi:hypothetical protein
MLPKVLIAPCGNLFSAVLCSAFLVCFWSFDSAAQSKRPKRNVLPRVGTIKDYPATGLMTGCANLYFHPASIRRATDTNYIFLARGDGDDAWMNLGGRDVRLQQVKLLTNENRKLRRYYYRFGSLRLSVVIKLLKPEDAQVKEGDSMFKMTITLRQGKAVRIVKAIGDSDC